MLFRSNVEEIEKAILQRFESICNDMDSIKDIVKASKIKISYKKFCNNPYQYNRSGHYLVWILACLDTFDLYSDREEFENSLCAASVDGELDFINRYVKETKEEYIKRQYQKIMKMEGKNG